MSPPEDPRIADLPEGGEVIADISEEELAIREFGRKMAELPEGVPVPDELVQ